jgi:hypothetical protein
LRGFVSIILHPFQRVFAISAFLKVIAPKTPETPLISEAHDSTLFLVKIPQIDQPVQNRSMGSPDCKDLKKNICGKVIFQVPDLHPLLGFLKGFGGVDDF